MTRKSLRGDVFSPSRPFQHVMMIREATESGKRDHFNPGKMRHWVESLRD
jgi:hypothetical protein